MTVLSRRSFGVLALGGLLAACSSGNPLSSASAGGTPTASGPLVVGSQAYYSNEIIAELYAQALEKAGRQVNRQYQIGQREVYMPEIKNGKIDVFPEYSGNLLQYLDKTATAKDAAAIHAALEKAMPQGLRVLASAAASDQDSFTTTKAYATQHGVTSMADLAKVGGTIKIAANSEFSKRPYGPKAVKDAYGVDLEVVGVEDSGGSLTVKALTDGTVQLADIYTADPAIAKLGLVVLEDPKSLILPQNVTPIVSAKVDDATAAAIDRVSAALTPGDLQRLNARSVDEKLKSADIAKAWLTEKGLL